MSGINSIELYVRNEDEVCDGFLIGWAYLTTLNGERNPSPRRTGIIINFMDGDSISLWQHKGNTIVEYNEFAYDLDSYFTGFTNSKFEKIRVNNERFRVVSTPKTTTVRSTKSESEGMDFIIEVVNESNPDDIYIIDASNINSIRTVVKTLC